MILTFLHQDNNLKLNRFNYMLTQTNIKGYLKKVKNSFSLHTFWCILICFITLYSDMEKSKKSACAERRILISTFTLQKSDDLPQKKSNWWSTRFPAWEGNGIFRLKALNDSKRFITRYNNMLLQYYPEIFL